MANNFQRFNYGLQRFVDHTLMFLLYVSYILYFALNYVQSELTIKWAAGEWGQLELLDGNKSKFSNLMIFFPFFNDRLFVIWKSVCWFEEIHSFYFDTTISNILIRKLVSLMKIGCSFSWCFGLRFLNNRTDCFKKGLFSVSSRIVFKEECNSRGNICMRRDRDCT